MCDYTEDYSYGLVIQDFDDYDYNECIEEDAEDYDSNNDCDILFE